MSCTVAIRIPDRNWRKWLDAAARTLHVRTVEASAALLAENPAFLPRLAALDLDLVHVRELLPDETARHLFEAPPKTRDDLRKHVDELLRRAEAAGARSADLEFGLDRIEGRDPEEALRRRIDFLRDLLKTVNPPGIDLCVPVRHPPPFPGARTRDAAANLLFEVMDPACRLAVGVFPAELPPEMDIGAFLREYYLQTAVFRFHWQPALGEELDPDRQRQWADALIRHSYRGCVVFCPRARQPEAIAHVVDLVDSLAPLFRRSI